MFTLLIVIFIWESRYFSLFVWPVVWDEMKSRHWNRGPLWIVCCEVVSPFLSSFFQKRPSSFPSHFHTEPQVSKDFGVGSSRFTGGCRYWASFLTSLSRSFSVHVMGMRLLALPGVEIDMRHRFSVQLAGRTPLPSQLSYRRNAGAGLATGDFPCVGS